MYNLTEINPPTKPIIPGKPPCLNIGKILRVYRKTLGLGLPEMASILGIPKTILYRFECGRPIAQNHLIAIMKWLWTEQ